MTNTFFKPLSIVAKCTLCSTKDQLYVCSHCDNILCQTCIHQHPINLNGKLKEEWLSCQTKYSNLRQTSDSYAKESTNITNEIDHVRLLINQRCSNLVNLIENERNHLLNQLEEYARNMFSNSTHSDLQTTYESIDERLNTFFQDSDSTYNVEDFLLEVEHLNGLIVNQEKQIQPNIAKYPSLSPPRQLSMSDVLGELQWNLTPMPHHLHTRSSTHDSRSITPLMNGCIPSESNDESQEKPTNPSEKTTSMSVLQRQRQWSLEASGVPHFICVLSKKNHLLFACDKYGSIDLYQLDSNNPTATPRRLRQFELFPDNTSSLHPQIIETFTVYTPFIVVSAHLNDQADTSSVYFFDHRGIQQADTCVQNFPVRQLSADVASKCLWGIDRHQHLVYYNQLPINVQQILLYMNHREEFIKFDRNFEPIRIAQNQTSIAVVERNAQSAHIYNKQTKQHIKRVDNIFRTKGIFRLWNVLLRDDNSMILKLDEDLPPNSRPPSINHLIVEMNSDGQQISQIERTSVYGFAIGPNQEILLGCKRNQQNGIIECYS